MINKKSNFTTKKGFSLIEALVVIAVIAIMGILLSDLVSRTLKGGAKTQVIGNIKQNGQVTLNTLESVIRQADNVICPSSKDTPGKVLVVVKNGTYSRYWFYTPTTSNGYIASDTPYVSDSRHIIDFSDSITDPKTLNLCSSDTNGWPLDCFDSSNNKVACIPGTKASILTDQSNLSLAPNTASFTRSTSPGFKDVISIQFDLTPPLNNGSKVENQVGTNNTVHFDDIVELR